MRPAILVEGVEPVHTFLEQHFTLQALLAYQRITCIASICFTTTSWLRYDQRFCATAAANKFTYWNHKHYDLWLKCFTQLTVSEPPISKCGIHAPTVTTITTTRKTVQPTVFVPLEPWVALADTRLSSLQHLRGLITPATHQKNPRCYPRCTSPPFLLPEF